MAEHAIIKEILDRLGGRSCVGVILGSGDDAAVFSGASWPVVTVDTLVEGVHWLPELSAYEDVGFKLLSCNLSDVAAMGAEPGPMLLAWSLPADNAREIALRLAEGVALARARHGLEAKVVAPIGGDLTRAAGGMTLTLVLFGRLEAEAMPFTRSAAQADDRIWVSGVLGSSEAGLRALQHGLAKDPRFAPAVSQHRRPIARLDVSRKLRDAGCRVATIDLSDGLAGDLQRILDASGVGAEVAIDRLPVAPAAAELAREIGVDALEWAVGGGEDFELLVCAPPSADDLMSEIGLTRIGRVVADAGLVYTDVHGKVIERAFQGYEHF